MKEEVEGEEEEEAHVMALTSRMIFVMWLEYKVFTYQRWSWRG